MKFIAYSSVFLLAGFGGLVSAQFSANSTALYEGAASGLRSAPARQYNFSKAVMSDVMRLMAEDAGISFFGLPDTGEGNERLVTFTINAAPFTALETLAKANGVSLIHENGIWYLRPANDRELIGRIYEINYNAQELVRKNSQGGMGGGAGGGGMGGGGGGGMGAAGINLQGAPDFFEVEPSRLLEDIKGILDIQTTGGIANIAPTASVDTLAQLSLRGVQPQPGIAASPAPSADSDGQAKVIWNSDSNTLYVVATRQQHQWVEAYLTSADREQTLIAVEVKFLETSRDPSSDFGIDWTGVLGGDNGIRTNLSDATGPINLGSLGSYSLPTAVLSYADLNLKMRAICNDSRTRTVSYPRMVTLDNREVSFRSVINQPVLASSASASLGAGATMTSAIEYLPIGTVINVLPKMMNNGKILLNVSVTVSDIVGTEVINGNPFPIASSRVYTAPLTVASGFTVAISGLDAANCSHVETGIPVLGQIPVLGGAFKFTRKNAKRQHLMMLITPVVINGCGVTKKPMTKDPWCGPCATAVPVHVPGSAPVAKVKPAPAAPVGRVEPNRKSLLSFGQKQAPVTESAYASPVAQSSNNPPTSAPAEIPQVAIPPVPSVKVTPVASATAATTTAPATATTSTAKSASNQQMEIARINENVNRLRADLDNNKNNPAKISQVVEESKTLLSQIEAMRGSDPTTMTGELGDTWWNVIKLKSEASKLNSRE